MRLSCDVFDSVCVRVLQAKLDAERGASSEQQQRLAREAEERHSAEVLALKAMLELEASKAKEAERLAEGLKRDMASQQEAAAQARERGAAAGAAEAEKALKEANAKVVRLADRQHSSSLSSYVPCV